jgi:hypothetical protein
MRLCHGAVGDSFALVSEAAEPDGSILSPMGNGYRTWSCWVYADAVGCPLLSDTEITGSRPQPQ